jgi:hypothetical protein
VVEVVTGRRAAAGKNEATLEELAASVEVLIRGSETAESIIVTPKPKRVSTAAAPMRLAAARVVETDASAGTMETLVVSETADRF